MSNFEILSKNYVNTTSIMWIPSNDGGSSTFSNLIDRDRTTQFQSSNSTDGTYMSFYITLPSAQNISRIALQNINFKYFYVYYFGAVASITYINLANADTSISYWATNSSTAKYLKFSTISVNRVGMFVRDTIIPNQAKKMGEFYIGDLQFTFEDNPDSGNYNPNIASKEVVHEMSDGGKTKYVFGESYEAKIKLEYQSQAMYDNLYDLYHDRQSFVFVPFPTGTSWEGNHIYEVNWVGDFEFPQPAGNEWTTQGYNGQFAIAETPK